MARALVDARADEEEEAARTEGDPRRDPERYTPELMSDSGEIRKVAMKTTNCVP